MDKAENAARVLYHYLMLARAIFDEKPFEPPLDWRQLQAELLTGVRFFDGVEVADDLEPPIIRGDMELAGFFLEYIWRGGYQRDASLRPPWRRRSVSEDGH